MTNFCLDFCIRLKLQNCQISSELDLLMRPAGIVYQWLRFTFLLIFFLFDIRPFGQDGFSVPLLQLSFFFQFFRRFEMLLVLHNRLRHVNR